MYVREQAGRTAGARRVRRAAADSAISSTSCSAARRRAKGEARAAKGRDLEYALNIDFWQAISGTQVRLNITRQETCATCSGTGQRRRTTAVCPECNGSGQGHSDGGRDALQTARARGATERGGCETPVRHATATARAAPETVEVRIPPGAQTGSRLRVAGKGNAGTIGAPAGDLYITVGSRRIRSSARRRQHRDRVPVRVDGGGTGNARSKCRRSTAGRCSRFPRARKNGQKFRLREKGVFNARKDTARRPDRRSHASRRRTSETSGRARFCANEPDCIRRIRGPRSGRRSSAMATDEIKSRLHDLGGCRAVSDSSADAAAVRAGRAAAPSRSDGNTRLYTDEDLERLEVILQAHA